MEADHEEQKEMLMSKVHNIEEALKITQRSAISKEEELQLGFNERECNLMRDMQEARL